MDYHLDLTLKNKMMRGFTYSWSAASLMFLLFMLFTHIFGTEIMSFNNKKELIAFCFFPLGIILGLIIGFGSPLFGGIICLISVAISSFLIPDLLYNPYYLACVLPGILYFFLIPKKS